MQLYLLCLVFGLVAVLSSWRSNAFKFSAPKLPCSARKKAFAVFQTPPALSSLVNKSIQHFCKPLSYNAGKQLIFVDNSDDIKALVEGLLERTAQLEATTRTLLERVYVDDKTKIIGELAVTYKERVVEYTIFQDDHKYPYNRLIQRYKNTINQEFLREMDSQNPLMKARLVTTIDDFFNSHDVSAVIRATYTNKDALRAVERARAFAFKENDPDRQLAMDLCTVLSDYIYHGLLPIKENLNVKITRPGRFEFEVYDSCFNEFDYDKDYVIPD